MTSKRGCIRLIRRSYSIFAPYPSLAPPRHLVRHPSPHTAIPRIMLPFGLEGPWPPHPRPLLGLLFLLLLLLPPQPLTHAQATLGTPNASTVSGIPSAPTPPGTPVSPTTPGSPRVPGLGQRTRTLMSDFRLVDGYVGDCLGVTKGCVHP